MASAWSPGRADGGGGSPSSRWRTRGPRPIGPPRRRRFRLCSGQVLFVVDRSAVVDAPRLLEVVRTEPVIPGPGARRRRPRALAEAESRQASTGAATRFGPIFDEPPDRAPPRRSGRRVVSDRPLLAGRSPGHSSPGPSGATGSSRARFAAAADAFAPSGTWPVGRRRRVAGAVVRVGLPGRRMAAGVAEHGDIVGQLHHDAGWPGRPPTTRRRRRRCAGHPHRRHHHGWRSRPGRGQHARWPPGPPRAVTAFAVGSSQRGERGRHRRARVHLLTRPEADAWRRGAVVGDGWFGLRSHPRPGGSVTYGGPTSPTG